MSAHTNQTKGIKMYKIYSSSLRIYRLIYAKNNRPRRGIYVDKLTIRVARLQYRRMRQYGVPSSIARGAIMMLLGRQAIKF